MSLGAGVDANDSTGVDCALSAILMLGGNRDTVLVEIDREIGSVRRIRNDLAGVRMRTRNM